MLYIFFLNLKFKINNLKNNNFFNLLKSSSNKLLIFIYNLESIIYLLKFLNYIIVFVNITFFYVKKKNIAISKFETFIKICIKR